MRRPQSGRGRCGTRGSASTAASQFAQTPSDDSAAMFCAVQAKLNMSSTWCGWYRATRLWMSSRPTLPCSPPQGRSHAGELGARLRTISTSPNTRKGRGFVPALLVKSRLRFAASGPARLAEAAPHIPAPSQQPGFNANLPQTLASQPIACVSWSVKLEIGCGTSQKAQAYWVA